jgi:hypothetical protein
VGKTAADMQAVGLDDVLAERFGIERRQLTMPIGGLGAGLGIVRLRFDGTADRRRMPLQWLSTRCLLRGVRAARSVPRSLDPALDEQAACFSHRGIFEHRAWNIPPGAKVRRYLGG